MTTARADEVAFNMNEDRVCQLVMGKRSAIVTEVSSVVRSVAKTRKGCIAFCVLPFPSSGIPILSSSFCGSSSDSLSHNQSNSTFSPEPLCSALFCSARSQSQTNTKTDAKTDAKGSYTFNPLTRYKNIPYPKNTDRHSHSVKAH